MRHWIIGAVIAPLLLASGGGCGDGATSSESSGDKGVEGGYTIDGGQPTCPHDLAEATVALCSDGCDNDSTGYFDCGDVKCCAIRPDCPSHSYCGRRITGAGFDQPLQLNDERARSLDPTGLPAGPEACHPPALVRVTAVVDGDTFDVEQVDGGLSGPLRIIGVDTPELHGDGAPECYATEARAFTAQLYGHLVWLTFDRECADPHGRMLAYVHFGLGTNEMLQRHLLRRGVARAMPFGESRTFEALFAADQHTAQIEGAGLWGACQ